MKYRYPIAKPYIDEQDIDSAVNVLKSRVLSLGNKYKEFEEAICEYTGSTYACCVTNGTAGLHLAVRALGLSPGDEVITPSYSFVSSTNCLLYEHITPVFVDITEDSYTLDPKSIEPMITKKTKAILPVHVFGYASNMEAINDLASQYKLAVIEDACEGLGTIINNTQVGTMSDIGVYAFYPNKQITTGEGGMIVTHRKDLYELCVSMRNQGRNQQGDWLVHERLGFNYRMDEMSASLGITQLSKLEWMIEQKQEIVEWYKEFLSDEPELIVPIIQDTVRHSWFVYVVRVLSGKRNMLHARLNSVGIQVKPYFPAIHTQPYLSQYSYRKDALTITEKIASESLALPFYIGLKKNDIKHIASAIHSVLH